MGITFVFFSCRYWDVSLPCVGSNYPIYSDNSSQTLLWLGCPIRRSPVKRLFAPNRGLSQLTTSFIAFKCQGIRRTPLITWLRPLWHNLQLRVFLLLNYFNNNTRVIIIEGSILIYLHINIGFNISIYIKILNNILIRMLVILIKTTKTNYFKKQKNLVELTGLEPATPSVQGRCSPSWATAPNKKFCSLTFSGSG